MWWQADFDELVMDELDLTLGIDGQDPTAVPDLSQFLVTVEHLLEVHPEGIIQLGPTTCLDIIGEDEDPIHLLPDAIEEIEFIGWESQKREIEEWEVKRLKLEMAEISADQKSIREGQIHLTEKFKDIESECVQLREESKFISQQTAETNSRLNLLLKILEAREEKDFAKANNLTVSLRELIASQDEKIESSQMTRTSFED